jgi:hypothetical protein
VDVILANPERLAMAAIAAAFEPPPEIDYLRWAETNVSIDGKPYSRAAFPYFDEVLRASMSRMATAFKSRPSRAPMSVQRSDVPAL